MLVVQTRVKESIERGHAMGEKRGDMKEPLGGPASFCGGYVYCGPCSPEPLHYDTAVRMKVRKVGIMLEGGHRHVDVIECPKCGHQVIR